MLVYYPENETAVDTYNRLIFELYKHENLGFLIQAHAACFDESGFAKMNKRVNSINAGEYIDNISPDELSVLDLTNKLDVYFISKHFNKTKKTIKPEEFFVSQYNVDEKVKNAVNEHVESYLYDCLRKLRGSRLYIENIEGFTEENTVFVENTSAKAKFKFKKEDSNIEYWVELFHNNKPLNPRAKDAVLVTEERPTLKLNNKLFLFEDDDESIAMEKAIIPFSGKRLKPFLIHEKISIKPENEKVYIEKFISKLVEEDIVELFGYKLDHLTHQRCNIFC